MFAFFCTGRPADIDLFMWFCFVLWIYLKLSVFSVWRLVILVFVTCVTCTLSRRIEANERLAFFFCRLRINCDIQSWWPKISNAWVICIGWTVNILLGRLSCHPRTAFDEASSSCVCHRTYSAETGLIHRSCGGRAHIDRLLLYTH